MTVREHLSKAEARRIALAAQGFRSEPKLRTRRPFDPALDSLGVLQIDSVNVFSRSHYMPVFSRHGYYERAALDRLLWRSGEYTEYWAHEAAFIRTQDRPLYAWRMADYRDRFARGGRLEALDPHLTYVRDALAERGPSFVRDIEQGDRSTRGPWWDWSDTKAAVELLFATGEVVSAGRERFERRYALAADMLPPELLDAPPSREEAQLALVEQAARSLGVGTLADIADYHRLKSAEAKSAILNLQDAGVLLPVAVEKWRTPGGAPLQAWLHRDARVPSKLAPDALLTPFDPICWFRPRAERLFDFRYRIEIYTPAPKRQFGYYCLPLLIDGDLVGRIDLKADRKAGALLVQASWQEESAPAHASEAAGALLRRAADWQGLEHVAEAGRGNLRPLLPI